MAQNVFFKETAHHFGSVKGDSVSYTFGFENKGTKAIGVHIVHAPCGKCMGCIEVKHTEGYLKEGEKGEIRVKYTGYPLNGMEFQRQIVVYFWSKDSLNNYIDTQEQFLTLQGVTVNTSAVSILETEPDPFRFVPGAKTPKEVNLLEIQKNIGYPILAREMNVEGTIVFRILVDEAGNYMKHLPPKSGHPILIAAVEKEICNAKFTPAIQGEKPIKFWVNMPFVFKLN